MAQQGDQLAHGEPHGEPHGDLEKECGPLEVALGSGIERLQAAASRDEQQTDASNKDTAASLRILATRMANLGDDKDWSNIKQLHGTCSDTVGREGDVIQASTGHIPS